MPKEREKNWKAVHQAVSEDDREVTTVSELPYQDGGKLVRIQTKYRNRDGSYVVAEAVTYVPVPMRK